MSSISVTNINDGDAVTAASVNNQINTIVNDYNGNIASTNLANGAVTTVKITDANVTPAKWTNPYKFSAYRSASFNTANTLTLVQFDAENYDSNNNFDIATNKGRYTVPVSGFYHFSVQFGNSPLADTGQIVITLYKNGSLARTGSAENQGASGTAIASISCDLQLTAGDYVEVFFQGGNGSAAAVGQTANNFDGYLISVT